MATVTVEIFFKDGTSTDRLYESEADNPEADALEQAKNEWGASASVIRVISVHGGWASNLG